LVTSPEKMRHTLLRCLSMTFYVIVLWPYKFSKSEDICEDSKLQHRQNVIVQNDSYQYSLHYNYSMRIRCDQLHPVVSNSFIKFSDDQKVNPKFSFKYYDSDVYSFHIDKTGAIAFNVGQIFINIPNFHSSDFEILNDKELVAVKWSFKSNEDGTDGTAKITCLIHANGKISLYFANIPSKIQGKNLQIGIIGQIYCKTGVKSPRLNVPAKWIKSGTLMEYEVIGTMCSKYTTTESCQKEKTSDMTCIWCDKANKCIASNDQDTQMLKVNDCHVETNSKVTDLSTSTPIQQSETTSDVTEVEVEEDLKTNSKVTDLSTSAPIQQSETTSDVTEVEVEEDLKTNSKVTDLSTSTPIQQSETTSDVTEVEVEEDLKTNSKVTDLSTSTPIQQSETTSDVTEVEVEEDLKTNSEIEDLSTPASIKRSETTSGVTEVQTEGNVKEVSEKTAQQSNLTTKTIEVNKHKKSSWYLYIVIPLVVSLFLIFVGCFIWIWINRKWKITSLCHKNFRVNYSF
uniref:Egg protein CP391S-like protein n=1 Tax=Schistosoma mansoni TaxID=6183 RepID=A0AA82N831_SCHMA